MMTSITAKLLTVDRRLKSLEPNAYSRWLALPSCIVIALLTPWLLGSWFGVLRVHLSDLVWSLSAVFVGFSMVGVATVWRTRHSLAAKLGFLVLHLTAIALFLVPIVVFSWFIFMMSDH
jgi:hypothetical protein